LPRLTRGIQFPILAPGSSFLLAVFLPSHFPDSEQVKGGFETGDA